MTLDLKILSSHPIQYQAPLFHELVKRGFAIEVGYYHQGTAGKLGRDLEFGIDIQWDIDLLSGYPSRIFNTGIATYSLLEQVRVLPALASWILKDKKTPLLLMGWFAEVIWLLWLFAILKNVPIMIFGDTTPLSYNASPKPVWRKAILAWLLRHTNVCLYVGSRNKSFYKEMGVLEERLILTPESVDNDRFSTEASRLSPLRHELCIQYGLDPELPVFLFCGKLIPKKRPIQLLEAYQQAGLKEKAQLVFVGDGMLRPEIERQIHEKDLENVHLFGFWNQTKMPLAYVLGEILCLISDAAETWGLVANEALACGRPVILSDTVGCASDLVSPENGWLVPMAEPGSLANVMREAYEKRASWPEMGRRGKEKVSGYTFARMAAGVIGGCRLLTVS